MKALSERTRKRRVVGVISFVISFVVGVVVRLIDSGRETRRGHEPRRVGVNIQGKMVLDVELQRRRLDRFDADDLTDSTPTVSHL